MIETERLAVLRDELRHKCSFPEIQTWLNENASLRNARFSRVQRANSVPVLYGGPGGGDVAPWYVGHPERHSGWVCSFHYETLPYSWAARDFLHGLGLIRLSSLQNVTHEGGMRHCTHRAVLFSEDFPGMWLAEKLYANVVDEVEE